MSGLGHGLAFDGRQTVMDQQPIHPIRQTLDSSIETIDPLPNGSMSLAFALLELVKLLVEIGCQFSKCWSTSAGDDRVPFA